MRRLLLASARTVLLSAALVSVAIFVKEWTTFRAGALRLSAGIALVHAVQDAGSGEAARRGHSDWDAANRGVDKRRAIGQGVEALEARQRAMLAYTAMVALTAIAIVLLARAATVTGPTGVPLVILMEILAGALWWLEASESFRVVLQLGHPGAAEVPGYWRFLKLVVLSTLTGAYTLLLGGVARLWLIRFGEDRGRAPTVEANVFDILTTEFRRAAVFLRPSGQPPRAAQAAAPPAATSPHRALMQREWDGIAAVRADLERLRSRQHGPQVAPGMGPPSAADMRTMECGAADEPFVTFRAADLVGLALSGGGIRSATFNLGLLQGLNRRALLPLIDYLSTVSGGGYVGSFWSKWLTAHQCEAKAAQGVRAALFPEAGAATAARTQVESHEERHLREFGQFLAPRLGFLEVETWTALVAVVSGLLPASAIALSFIGAGLMLWLVLTIPLAAPTRTAGLPVIIAITALVFWTFERFWQEVKSPRQDASIARSTVRLRELGTHITFAVIALGVVAVLHVTLPTLSEIWRLKVTPSTADAAPLSGGNNASMTLSVEGPAALRSWVEYGPGRLAAPCPPLAGSKGPWRYVHPCWEPVGGTSDAWWRLAGLSTAAPDRWLFSPALFDFGVVWLVSGLLFVVLRLAHPLLPIGDAGLWIAPFDRVLMRLLGLATFWAAVAALWHVAINLDRLLLTVAGAIATASGFAMLRNWIGVAFQKPHTPGAWSRVKAALPQALAYATVLLTVAAVGQLLVRLCGDAWYAWWKAGSAMGGVLIVGLFVNPARFGLHAFYRARITRAYAGACTLDDGGGAAANRTTDPRRGDDERLSDLPRRPLHLVCCAANDLSGADIGTLGRGARSAVLSRYGLAIGGHDAPVGDLTLGAAVTASAAAFNSSMGDVSMKLGPAVSFVMTGLNLRLGLWLRHPKADPERPRRWPGILLYREFFGLTSASGQIIGDVCPPHLRDVHLSDGGHFENLGLYELVRRHCRYILVSDCGADPAIAFDDLGRALRRIRIDFGVDVEMDVDALRPDADGHSRKHVAVGRIHYSPTDVGILLYVKPSLTGDELADLRQYKTRNGAFPHEGTGDQFYDEAQWESYRRLGLHVADTVFDFVPPAADPASGAPARVTADWVFGEAAYRWGTTPPGLEARVLEMTARVAAMELDLQRSSARPLVQEVFPELRSWVGEAPSQGSAAAHAAGTPADTSGVVELVIILRVTQAMEDVWTACELDTWWSHPLNMGWVNFFARWVTSPTFRFWWPLLGPMYSKGFRDFLDDRFPEPGIREGTREELGVPWEGTVLPVVTPGIPEGLAATWWTERSAQPCPWRPRRDGKPPLADILIPGYFENILTRTHPRGGPVRVQVGLVATWALPIPAKQAVVWTSDDFFVPPSLWGASIGWYFLDNLLNRLAATHTWAYVVVRGPREWESTHVAADDTRTFIDQYRKIGFRQRVREHGRQLLPDGAMARLTTLEFRDDTDTLLELDLEQWARTRGRARPDVTGTP